MSDIFFQAKAQTQVNEGLRNYMLYVYQYMSGALGLSALMAFLFASIPGMNAFILSPAGLLIALIPFGIGFFFMFKISTMELKTAQVLFWVYSASMGASLSYVFLVYTGASVVRCFLVTSATFLAMSIYGYSTKRDLTSFGSFLVMGLIGVLIASLVNIFLHSSALDFALSILSLFIFIGLTAWDTQKVKNMYYVIQNGNVGPDMARKIAILGALSLYMDFVNLFITLLKFFGDRRSE